MNNKNVNSISSFIESYRKRFFVDLPKKYSIETPAYAL